MTFFSPLKSAALAGVLAVAVAAGQNVAPAAAGAFSSADVVRPLAGLSFVIGSKHAVGYFTAESGGCDLTLLIADSTADASERPRGAVPARFKTLIAAGRTARIDTGDGPSLEFFCSTGAAWLTTRLMERVAYTGPAR